MRKLSALVSPSSADEEQRPRHDPEDDQQGEVGQPSDGHLHLAVDVQLQDVNCFVASCNGENGDW